jgi:hypothetical protein
VRPVDRQVESFLDVALVGTTDQRGVFRLGTVTIGAYQDAAPASSSHSGVCNGAPPWNPWNPGTP